MGSAFLETIGFLGSALGIIQFGLDNFPGESKPSGAVVGFKAGLAKDLSGAGGGIKAVYGYDADNEYLGSGDGGNIDEGGIFSSTIDQGVPGAQADFVGATFTDDAVCVAWITVTMQDGSPSGAWTGDVGSNCGEVWYHQTQTAGQFENGTAYVPDCTWFDANHDAGDHASLKFRTRAYGLDANSTVSNGHTCDSTIYGTDDTPIDGQPAKRKRAPEVRPQWITEQLIVSSVSQHSAKALCDSETSWGPDFIDSHGQFCDMGTKTLSPLCTVSNTVGCLELESRTITKRATVNKREVKLAHKTYAVTKQW